MDVFPVDPSVRPGFSDRFGANHQGTDIFAPTGTACFAVVDGVASNSNDPKGGRVVYLKGHDGRTYYYAHLSEWSSSESPRAVEAGDLVGYVGTTGNATGREPHLHFGIYTPSGAVDPFPELKAAYVPDTGPQPAPTVPAQPPRDLGWVAVLVLLLMWKRKG